MRQKIIQNIQRALPNEVLPCSQEQREHYLEMRAIIQELTDAKEVPAQMEQRINALKEELKKYPILASEFEIASILLEKLQRLQEIKQTEFDATQIQTLFTQAEGTLKQFEASCQKTSLTSEEKKEHITAFREELAVQMKQILDDSIGKVEQQCCQKLQKASDIASFEEASKSVWEAINQLGLDIPETESLQDIRQHFQDRAKEACATIGTSFQTSRVISDLNNAVMHKYETLLQEVQGQKFSQAELEEKKKEIQALMHEVMHPVEIGRCLKQPVPQSGFEHLNVLLQTNTKILVLLQQIDTAIVSELTKKAKTREPDLPKILPSAAPEPKLPSTAAEPEPVPSATRIITQAPNVPTQAMAAAKADGIQASIIKGAAVSAVFACLGVTSGLTIPMAAVLGLGTMAACTLGSGLETKDKYVTLLSGMATMGLMAYFSTTMVSSNIIPLDLAQAAIGHAVNETLTAVLPSTVQQAVNTTAPAVIFSFAHETLPALVAETVNSTVVSHAPPIILKAVENVVAAGVENVTTTVFSQKVEEFVPAIVNSTLEAVVPDVVFNVTQHVVNTTVSSVAQEVATSTTPDFVSFVYQQCAAAGLNQEACVDLATTTLSPALQKRLMETLTPALLQQFNTELTPALVMQLKEKLGPALVSEFVATLQPALKEGLLTQLIPQLSEELIEKLPQELIVTLSNNLTPAFIEKFIKNITPELTKQLVERLTPELQQQLQKKLAPEIFERLLPLFTKIESIRWANMAKGAGFVILGAVGIAVSAPLAAPVVTVGAIFTAASGVAKILGWI